MALQFVHDALLSQQHISVSVTSDIIHESHVITMI